MSGRSNLQWQWPWLCCPALAAARAPALALAHDVDPRCEQPRFRAAKAPGALHLVLRFAVEVRGIQAYSIRRRSVKGEEVKGGGMDGRHGPARRSVRYCW